MPAILVGRYEVSDRERFLEVFGGSGGGRAGAGPGAGGLLAVDGPDTLVAMIEFATAEAAWAFARSPERADALARATVTAGTDEVLEVGRPRAAAVA